MLTRSGDIRDQNLKWYKIDQNFACFGSQILLAQRPPPPRNFWTCVIKFSQFPFSNHAAKFHGDPSRDLGERVAKYKRKKKENICCET